MGEVYSPFIVSSSGTKDLCGKGLKGKDQGSLSSIVSLSKPKTKMVYQILSFCTSVNHKVIISPVFLYLSIRHFTFKVENVIYILLYFPTLSFKVFPGITK